MKKIKLTERKTCDACYNDQTAYFNAPTRKDSIGRGRWANLCNGHMASIGIATSVSEQFEYVT